MLDRIRSEMDRASERYGPFTSSHEGLGVVTEEYDELKDAIRANDPAAIIKEAVQLAAVAWRLAEAMEQPATIERSRK